MVDVKDKDSIVLSYFRNNARTSLTRMSKAIKIPVSTIYDKLKSYEENDVIKKHTSIVDFNKLDYGVRVQLLIRCFKESKEHVLRFLMKSPKINNVYRISNGFDFMVEAIFKSIDEFDQFLRKLDDLKLDKRQEFFVMEDVRREDFLTFKQNIGVIR